MKSRINLAVLKILSLKEEFNERELLEAVQIISEGRTEDLLSWLAESNRPDSKKTSAGARKLVGQQSRAVIELKDKEPERYELLSELDDLLRKCVLLPRLEDIRRFGEDLSKTFEAGKSRKEAIPRLMEILANEPMDRLKGLSRRLLDEVSNMGGKEAEYEKLASFLMHGNRKNT